MGQSALKSLKRELADDKYEVEIRPTANKDFEKIPTKYHDLILQKFENLAFNPRPRGSLLINRKRNRYRIRTGIYRIIYSLDFNSRVVLIEFVRHRKDIYRGLD